MSSEPSKKSAAATPREIDRASSALAVQQRISISRKQVGEYHAFPTLIKARDHLWLACRSGEVDKTKPHGDKGRIRLFSASWSNPSKWREHAIQFDCAGPHGNELDAILSGPFGDTVFLATRDYGDSGNTPFLSTISLDALADSSSTIERVPLKEMLQDEIGLGACFGHIRMTSDGTLLMPYYAVLKGGKCPSPVLLASDDFGQNWYIRAVLASSDAFGAYLNEFSVINVRGSEWLAIVRTNTTPHPLYLSRSADDGNTWTPFAESGLYGHAPMLEKDHRGRTLLLYRDLSDAQPGISIASWSDDETWQKLGSVTTYCGGLYDGGYGDVLCLGDGRYLAAGYFSDKAHSPWVDAFLLTLD